MPQQRERIAQVLMGASAILAWACGSAEPSGSELTTPAAGSPSPSVASSPFPATAPVTESPSAEAVERDPAAFIDGQPYKVSIAPANFVVSIDHPFMPLTPGTTFTFKGAEKVVVTVTRQSKSILGVPATVVRDRVFVDGALEEDTFDWFAQDRQGNVWYLGEKTAEYSKGKVVSTQGSWEAGVHGAQPGIVMLADPRAGDVYHQEYLAGEAEDLAKVTRIGGSISVPLGTFDNVLVTEEWTPLEPGIRERKTYASGVGLIESRQIRGGKELVQLTSVAPGG